MSSREMSGSDTESSTIHKDQILDISTEIADQRADTSKEIYTERTSVEKAAPHGITEKDTEKGDVDLPPQSSAPPGLNPADFPDGGLEAWLVVVGGSLILFCTYGIINCSGVFIQYYSDGPLANYSSSTITWITSVQTFLVTGSNLPMGRLFDSHGTTWILPIGTIFYSFGLMVLSLSTKYYQIILSQGIVCGIGAAAVFNCASNATLTWFFKRRAAALGIVYAGSSLGGILLPILMTHLIPRIGFPWTIRILGFIVLALCGTSCFIVKSRLPPRPKPFAISELTKPFTELRFTLLVVGCFFVFWGFYLPFNYLNIQAQQQGINPTLVPYLLPIVNALSIPGRIVPGIVADHVGRFNMIIIICLFTAIITLGLWVPSHTTGETIAFGAIYGFTSGAFISLSPAVVAQVSDIREIGARNGISLFLGSLGALTGPPIGGAILGSENGNYLGLELWTGLTILIGTIIIFFSRAVQVKFKPVII
ncbi:monocarboxylate permease-like protein [Xylaria intraflava]|nr:monocarboxylate permease-like protein [Xylaria intraflava]